MFIEIIQAVLTKCSGYYFIFVYSSHAGEMRKMNGFVFLAALLLVSNVSGNIRQRSQSLYSVGAKKFQCATNFLACLKSVRTNMCRDKYVKCIMDNNVNIGYSRQQEIASCWSKTRDQPECHEKWDVRCRGSWMLCINNITNT